MNQAGVFYLTQPTQNQYQFNGTELNEDFGLNWEHHGFRFYDPAIGRFPSVDALAGHAPGWTPYRFGFNNPLRYSDPLGLFEVGGNEFSMREVVIGSEDIVAPKSFDWDQLHSYGENLSIEVFSNLTNGNDSPPDHIVIPNDENRDRVLNDLAKVYATPLGKTLIDILMESENYYTIDGQMWTSQAWVSPNYYHITKELNYNAQGIFNVDGITPTRGFITLGHELKHTLQHEEWGLLSYMFASSCIKEKEATMFANYLREIYDEGWRPEYKGLIQSFDRKDGIPTNGLRLNASDVQLSPNIKFDGNVLKSFNIIIK